MIKLISSGITFANSTLINSAKSCRVLNSPAWINKSRSIEEKQRSAQVTVIISLSLLLSFHHKMKQGYTKSYLQVDYLYSNIHKVIIMKIQQNLKWKIQNLHSVLIKTKH